MAQKKKTRPKNVANSVARRAPAADDLERVRQILLQGETAALEQRFQKELAALRRHFEKNFRAVNRQLEEETAARQRQFRSLSSRVTAMSKAFDEKLSRLRQSSTKAGSKTRQQVEASLDELRGEFDERHEEIVEEVGRELVELKANKTDRAALSALLGDFAKKIGTRKNSRN